MSLHLSAASGRTCLLCGKDWLYLERRDNSQVAIRHTLESYESAMRSHDLIPCDRAALDVLRVMAL